jgi:UDP-N-acetylmuramoylalanine--D-glutamate ligase
LFATSAVLLPGEHLKADLLAAAVAARALGVPAEAIARAVGAFRGAEHVLEHVATVRGVAYFNDSKATNVLAAGKSVESFPGPVLLILGGRYKGGDFADLLPSLAGRGRVVYAIGEARSRIAQALGKALPVVECASLREAVERAHAEARPGDTVLLAPACSSFDMFTDYADRGSTFKAEVGRLGPDARSGASTVG